MLKQSTAKGIRLGLAVFLASFAGQALAGTYVYDGTASACTTTCDSFDSLAVGSLLDGGIDIDVGANDSYGFADVSDFSFLVFNPALPVVPFDGTNPTTANPLPINPSIAEVRDTGFGTDATAGMTGAAGELISGQLLFEFTVPPFSSNAAWVVIDVGTGEAQVCVFYLSVSCASSPPNPTVVIDGGFSTGLAGSLTPYSQDLEALVIDDPDALGNDGWTVFGNVFDSTGAFKFGYGPFSAPNGGPGFSGIIDGQGGATQGAQQLSVYNDYNCCEATGEGHFNGTDLVESNVFQEQVIGLADVGSTWKFSFDHKKGDLAGDTTALAFIKTLDPYDGFSLSTDPFLSADMTSISTDWQRTTLTIDISANLVGHLLQIGFASTASNFESSQNIYDNVLFTNDTDGDGLADTVDNCTDVANPGQQDADGDGHGNICDPDFDQTCSVNFGDLNQFKGAFLSADPNFDLDSSGFVNFADLQIVKAFFLQAPGPSAPGALCN